MNKLSTRKWIICAIGCILIVNLLIFLTLPHIISHYDDLRTQALHKWLLERQPFLAAAMKVPGATVDSKQVGQAGSRGPTAPELTYLVLDRHDEYLLIAWYRLRLDADDKPKDIELSFFRCLNLRNSAVNSDTDTAERHYFGVFIDETSFASAVDNLTKNDRVSSQLRARMASDSRVMAGYMVKYDPYARFLPENK